MESNAMTTSEFHLNVPLSYVETTIPAGMTIAEYRARRPGGASHKNHWFRRRRRSA